LSAPLHFGPFELKSPRGPLLHDGREVRLPRKGVAVLWLLASQPGEVVTKSALLDAVWPRTSVGEDAVTFQIQAIRQALGDDARNSHYLATVHRVGFRFVAEVTGVPRSAVPVDDAHGGAESPASLLVGRRSELAQLRELYERARRGQRQVVFVTGEAGVGKTALVEAFSMEVASETKAPLVGQGQCVEQHGAGEAYLPMLEALGRLCRHAQGQRVIEVIRRVAPSWAWQLPATRTEAPRKRAAGPTRERLLHEMGEALDVLSADRPLVLVLDDLQWSDASTIELVAMVARRREAARLLVLASYRPAEVIVHDHPLKAMKRELIARKQACEVVLGNLAPGDVATYLRRRFPDRVDGEALRDFVYRRTEGHPLFMVQVADYLAGHAELGPRALDGSIEEVVPQGLLELIEAQVERLTDAEQEALGVGSVAGAEFAAASLAAGAELPLERAEGCCEGLARRGLFLEGQGLAAWPDGTVSCRYGFRHSLHHDAIYQRLAAGRRARLHLVIGTREEVGYGARAGEIATRLAFHFERGHDARRAIHYLQTAAENAALRNACPEAIRLLMHGIELCRSLPDNPERSEQERALQTALGRVG